MSMRYDKKRVNVSPIGFEYDRIVLPIREKGYDKIIMISHKGKVSDKAVNYSIVIEKELKDLNIEKEFCDVNDLYDSLRLFYKILKNEKGNELWINLSSGSKIVAMAGMLASMMFGDENLVTPFYVVPKVQVRDGREYDKLAKSFVKQMKKKHRLVKVDKPESFGIESTFVMPHFKVEGPNPKIVTVLKIIESSGGTIGNSDLKNKLIESGLIKSNPKNKAEHRSTPFAAVKRKFLDKMQGLIEEKHDGRNKIITLTDEGKNILKIFGDANGD